MIIGVVLENINPCARHFVIFFTVLSCVFENIDDVRSVPLSSLFTTSDTLNHLDYNQQSFLVISPKTEKLTPSSSK